jgi:DNA-binding winged helix-turn-helix (wHTH) protein
MVRAFSDCELDPELYQLRRLGRVVKIEPKVFDVLAFLLDHRDRVVSKDELLDALWPGETVTESVLPRCVAAARRAVGDDRARQQILQTVHGRGYRFVADVHEREPGAVASPADARAPSLAQPLFVGREAALGRLGDALDAAVAGSGRIVLLVGEPGIGKTRTADEVTRLAQERGARVHVGRCFEGEGAPAFWPWLQILRDCVQALPTPQLEEDLGVDAAALAQLIPELRGRLPNLPAGDGSEGEQARFRLFDGITGFLLRMARREPLLLILDDLHWSDDATLRLFEFLAAELREAPVLLLGTYRDVEVRREHPLSRLLGALARQPDCERVALHGLGADEVARLVEAVAGQAPSPALVAAVCDMTEGNPFFIHELVRLLADQGRLSEAQDERTWSLALPQSVRDAVGRRLDALSGECNVLLRIAAVLGREFGLKTLESVSGLRSDELLEQLGEALDARVLVEPDGGFGRYAFSHALVRQTLYDELRAPQRIALHRRVGEALEVAWGARADAPLAELAHHFFEAAPGAGVDKALDYAVRAARRAHELLAYEESARLYGLALDVLDLELPPDELRRCELLLALGDERAIAGVTERARESFERAAELARRLGRVDLFGLAAMGYRGFGEMGNPAEPLALALLADALESLGDDHPAIRARLLSRLTGTPPHSLSMANRERLSEEALGLARKTGDPTALKDALGARLWASLGPDHVPRRLELARELLDLAVRLDDPRIALDGYESLFGAHLILGDMPAADRALALHVELHPRQPRGLRRSLRRGRAPVPRGAGPGEGHPRLRGDRLRGSDVLAALPARRRGAHGECLGLLRPGPTQLSGHRARDPSDSRARGGEPRAPRGCSWRDRASGR